MNHTLNLSCPVCQTQTQRDYLSHLNAQKHPELAKDLQEGRLFEFECDTCGAKRQLAYQFLYHDPARQYMIFLLPEYRTDSAEIEAILEDIMATTPFALGSYRLRIVMTVPELIEKIHIFNAGYDDRAVELVKLLTDGLFAQEKPTTPVKARYFYMQSSQPHILYVTDSEQILTEFHKKLLSFVQTKYHKQLAEADTGEFALYQHNWALSVIERKDKEKASEDK